MTGDAADTIASSTASNAASLALAKELLAGTVGGTAQVRLTYSETYPTISNYNILTVLLLLLFIRYASDIHLTL